jgi:hypothetical protein
MDYETDIVDWLQSLPLGSPVEIDDEVVSLDVKPAGAVLSGRLLAPYTQAQLQDALACGFRNALFHEAGLGVSPDGNELVLNRWLPNVRRWADATQELEDLLNQLAAWRAELAPSGLAQSLLATVAGRNEQRLRRLFAGAK